MTLIRLFIAVWFALLTVNIPIGALHLIQTLTLILIVLMIALPLLLLTLPIGFVLNPNSRITKNSVTNPRKLSYVFVGVCALWLQGRYRVEEVDVKEEVSKIMNQPRTMLLI